MKGSKMVRKSSVSGNPRWAWHDGYDGKSSTHIPVGWTIFIEYVVGQTDWAEALGVIGKIIDETDYFADLEFFVKLGAVRDHIIITGDVDPMLFKLMTDLEPVYFDDGIDDCS